MEIDASFLVLALFLGFGGGMAITIALAHIILEYRARFYDNEAAEPVSDDADVYIAIATELRHAARLWL